MRFLFPGDYFEPRRPDALFAAQAEALRRVEDLDPASEQRYFVWHDKAYAPDGGNDFPAPLLACLGRIDSRFYSVDIACNRQGMPRLVELGDGQVSDLVGWEPERFAAMFAAD